MFSALFRPLLQGRFVGLKPPELFGDSGADSAPDSPANLWARRRCKLIG